MDEYKTEICCPFNKKICIEKQKHFDDWKEAVEVYAARKTSYLFHTSGEMFEKCPKKYTALCVDFAQKQRS